MLLLLFSPFLGLFADYLRQKFEFSRLLTISIVMVMTLPSLIIWLSGYSYSNTIGNYIGITLFITGALFGIYSYDSGELSSKTKSSIALVLVIGLYILLFLLSSIFSQKTDKIFSKTSFQNYKAIHIRDFDLVLSGPQRVTIKRTNLRGLIEKTIYNELLPNPDTIPNCTLFITDGERELSFNYCKNKLGVEK